MVLVGTLNKNTNTPSGVSAGIASMYTNQSTVSTTLMNTYRHRSVLKRTRMTDSPMNQRTSVVYIKITGMSYDHMPCTVDTIAPSQCSRGELAVRVRSRTRCVSSYRYRRLQTSRRSHRSRDTKGIDREASQFAGSVSSHPDGTDISGCSPM